MRTGIRIRSIVAAATILFAVVMGLESVASAATLSGTVSDGGTGQGMWKRPGAICTAAISGVSGAAA